MTHAVWACRRRLASPSGITSACSLSAGRCLPQNGQRYVAGLRFCARRTVHQRGCSVIARRTLPADRARRLTHRAGQPVSPDERPTRCFPHATWDRTSVAENEHRRTRAGVACTCDQQGRICGRSSPRPDGPRRPRCSVPRGRPNGQVTSARPPSRGRHRRHLERRRDARPGPSIEGGADLHSRRQRDRDRERCARHRPGSVEADRSPIASPSRSRPSSSRPRVTPQATSLCARWSR